MALNLGLRWAQDDADDYLGGSLGLALFNAEGPRVVWRLDAVAAWQEMAYALDMIVDPAGEDPAPRTFHEKAALLNTTLMATIASQLDGPLNVFLNGGFGNKSYFDFDEAVGSAESTSLEFSGGYTFWGPGLSLDLDRNARALAGLRFQHPGEIEGDVDALKQVYLELELGFGD